jgi:peptidoglycan/xylan/chitin deacetylase (PgdA/CDA1 family)
MNSWPAGTQAAVTFSFDDGFAQTYESTAFFLHERGVRATYHLITGCVGGTFEGIPLATWAQWQDAARWGHEIASHGATHTPMAGPVSAVWRVLAGFWASPRPWVYARQLAATAHALRKWPGQKLAGIPGNDRLLSDLVNSRLSIEHHLPGIKVESFAYPTGRHQAFSRHLVFLAGFTSACTSDLGLNDPSCDFLTLRAVTMGPGLEVDDLIPWMDRALQRHAWLIIGFHLVSENNPAGFPYFCSQSKFQRLLGMVQSRPFWIATQGQVIRHWNLPSE